MTHLLVGRMWAKFVPTKIMSSAQTGHVSSHQPNVFFFWVNYLLPL